MAQQSRLIELVRGSSPFDPQKKASDPGVNVWVSASAGTGKTKVLTDRILRLLLAGTDPSKILALTFTKAAAAEMRERLLTRLEDWVSLPDEALCDILTALIDAPVGEEDIQRARKLFDLVLDTGDRMKIVTLHSFCQSLLAQFPLEARVPFGFKVLDEEDAYLLLKASLSGTLTEKENEEDLKVLTQVFHPETFLALLEELLQKRRFLREAIAEGRDAYEERVKKVLRLSHASAEEIKVNFWEASLPTLLEVKLLAEALQAGSSKDQRKAALLKEWEGLLTAQKQEEALAFLPRYTALFLTKEGEVRKTLATQKALKAAPQLSAFLEQEAGRTYALEQALRQLTLFQISKALFGIGTTVYRNYQTLKTRFKHLDYEDLIEKTAALLREESLSPWVLFKLDGGVDHILIDEAQDTNARQWAIVDALLQEFFGGEGARKNKRTLFVVGDEKQAIYSFQGTDPNIFTSMKHYYAAKVFAAKEGWKEVSMTLSFRSSPPILAFVDKVFSIPQMRKNLAGLLEEDISHSAHRRHLGGRVEVWPPLIEEGEEKILSLEDWLRPQKIEPTVTQRTAKRIARTIKAWIEKGKFVECRGRALWPEDILILLRQRGRFMEEMIRALKAEGIPVAGVDRMVLTEHLAVQDLLALARFLLLTRDDMSLACILKSPLFGWEEEELMMLCLHRGDKTIWETLQREKHRKPLWRETEQDLRDLLGKVDYATPYQLFMDVLDVKGRYQRFLERFGGDVSDVLDVFLSVTLSCEMEEGPSLQRFLSWIEERSLEIKRELSRNHQKAVRVMTVHGAKGLQAPVVFLCDAAQKPALREALLSDEENEILLWLPPQQQESAFIQEKKSEKREALEAEYRRLLYVALTRAEEHLLICGWQGSERTIEGTWYEALLDSIRHLGVPEPDEWGGERWTYAKKGQGMPLVLEQAPRKIAQKNPPSWMFEKAKEREGLPAWQSVTEISREEEDSKEIRSSHSEAHVGMGARRGQAIHKLLEILPDLPREKREKIGRTLLRERLPRIPETERDDFLKKVLILLENPSLETRFRQKALSEQPLLGIVDGKTVLGQIDRLIFEGETITIVDYKTHVHPEAVPGKERASYEKQLRTYAKLVKDLYPTYAMKAALLWTETAQWEDVSL